jgi:fructose-specific phosphotransferase system IIC component
MPVIAQWTVQLSFVERVAVSLNTATSSRITMRTFFAMRMRSEKFNRVNLEAGEASFGTANCIIGSGPITFATKSTDEEFPRHGQNLLDRDQHTIS